jgi:adenine-specific DNA-methyltransferase
VATDRDLVVVAAVDDAVAELNAVPGHPGYVTETFCESSRFFQPANGARIDAVRDAIAERYAGSWLEPLLLTSLLEAADRVDSTTGVQMAYVKQWADRSFRPLELRVPSLLPGPGRAVRGDACAVAPGLGEFDLAYLDPPYNQHRYDANYHIWETVVAWDAPDHYGVACKRTEIREGVRSAFNSRRTMPGALEQVVRDVRARLLVLSYNDESWITLDDLIGMCRVRGHVEVLAFASNRYVGARIGIHNPAGERVGSVGRLRNLEYVLIAGERDEVRHAVDPWRDSLVVARAS